MTPTDLITFARDWLVPAPIRSLLAPRTTKEAVPIPKREPDPFRQLGSRRTKEAAPVPEREPEPFKLLDLPMDVFSLIMDEYINVVTFDEM